MADEYTFTQFLRSPNQVAEAADRVSQLVIRRRNAPDLVLMRADRQHWGFEGAEGAGRLLVTALSQLSMSGTLSAVGAAMPWTGYLSDAGRAQFAAELSKALVASAELNNFAPVGQLVAEWKATAALQADPDLAEALSRPIEVPSGQSVPEP